MMLYLCEKPSQGRDIAAVLGAGTRRDGYLEGSGICVSWCIGHLLEMVPPDGYKPEWKRWHLETLPIIPDHWQLEVKPSVAKQFAVIERLLAKAEQVVIATDADREGETIGREVLERCGYQGGVQRLWLSALDDASIRKALKALQPGGKTAALYQAGLGRGRADWLVGMNLSRAYTLLGRQCGYDGVLTVGRVQTPTLKLVVDRDRQIEQFTAVRYYDVLVQVRVEGGVFRAKWLPNPAVADAEGRCLDPLVAAAVVAKIQGQHGVISKAETKRVKESPPLPLELSTLQVEASRRWGLSAQETLDHAQALYETHKAITYPRTDCRFLPMEQFKEVATVLQAMVATDPALAELVRAADPTLCSAAWNDKKITAHHGMIPTGTRAELSRLSPPELRIYDLVRRHYLAQFFPAFEYDRTEVETLVQEELLRATGRVEMISGWKQVLREEVKEKTKEKKTTEEPEQSLPLVQLGQPAQVEQAKAELKETKPPARYTEGTLIAAMKSIGKGVDDPRLKQILRETAGIGTEATRASIIENLLKRNLLAKAGNGSRKHLVSQPAGRALVDILPHSVTDPATTAVWEQALDDIAQGSGSLDEFLGKATSWVSRIVSNARGRGAEALTGLTALAATQTPEAGSPPCPLCGHATRRRKSARGFFWGCSTYPRCRGLVPDGSTAVPAG